MGKVSLSTLVRLFTRYLGAAYSVVSDFYSHFGGIFPIWRSACVYGEVVGFRGATHPDSPPTPPPAYNFLAPLGLDVPSSATEPMVGRMYISDAPNKGRGRSGHYAALIIPPIAGDVK